MKNPPIKTLKKKLDIIFSQYIRLVYRKCVLCGSTKNLNCGHVLSRRRNSTRWSEKNCFTQCYPCNFKHTIDTVPYYTWYIDTFGRTAFDNLYKLWNTIYRPNKTDLKFMIGYLTDKIKDLKELNKQLDSDITIEGNNL